MSSESREYWERRAREEREAAEQADGTEAAFAHRQLAQIYQAKADADEPMDSVVGR